MLARRLDTLIIASCRTTVDVFFHIERQNIPYVLIDRCLPGLSANFVGVDDESVGRLATKHLIDIGCKRIAHICGPEISPGIRRMEGYKRALAQAGMKVMDDYIVTQQKGDVGTKQGGAEAMRQLLSLDPRPDGLFCFNDPLAMGAMNYALDHGVRIPQDLAVVGCGNLHYDDSLRVPLSSIDQHSRRIGEEAARHRAPHSELKSTPKAGNCGDAARVDCARIDTPTHGQGHFKKGARKRQAKPKALKSPSLHGSIIAWHFHFEFVTVSAAVVRTL